MSAFKVRFLQIIWNLNTFCNGQMQYYPLFMKFILE